LGNGIDPIRLFDSWGVDASRMALTSYSIPGRDARASNQTVDERAKNYRNFSTKLWNIARFILSHQTESTDADIQTAEGIHPDDAAILARLDETIHTATSHLDNLELHLAAETLYEFVWHEFADKYIEATKARRAAAQPTLLSVLVTSLRLLHPFMPFVTEEIWSQIPAELTGSQPLIISPWPTTATSAATI
jgi:valyl-tRNA synthetase